MLKFESAVVKKILFVILICKEKIDHFQCLQFRIFICMITYLKLLCVYSS